MARKVSGAGAADFREMSSALASELVEDLNQEHVREVEALYQEQMEIREELVRIVQLMTTEILPREKQMHEMIERMHDAHEEATKHMHDQLSGMSKGGLTAEQQKEKAGLHDPLKDMEEELARIDKLLSHGAVRPDIAGWAPPAPAQPQRDARTPPRSGSPAPTRSPQQSGPAPPSRTQAMMQNTVGASAQLATAAKTRPGAGSSRMV